MASLQGSQTEKNILTAFAGESQARNRYTYFAAKARKEGYKQIEAIFAETADQEKSTPSGCSSCCKAARWRWPRPSRPG